MALIDAREEEIEGPLDVLRAGHALADLQLAVLGIDDAPTRQAARAVAAAWLMGAGPERDALLAEARALRRDVDPAALPILLPALSLGGMSAWRSRSPIGGRPGAGDTDDVARIDKSWVVLESIENDQHDRCVDLFRRPDGSFGFEAFRRDVEDAGAWTPVAYYSGAAYASKDAA